MTYVAYESKSLIIYFTTCLIDPTLVLTFGKSPGTVSLNETKMESERPHVLVFWVQQMLTAIKETLYNPLAMPSFLTTWTLPSMKILSELSVL